MSQNKAQIYTERSKKKKKNLSYKVKFSDWYIIKITRHGKKGEIGLMKWCVGVGESRNNKPRDSTHRIRREITKSL